MVKHAPFINNCLKSRLLLGLLAIVKFTSAAAANTSYSLPSSNVWTPSTPSAISSTDTMTLQNGSSFSSSAIKIQGGGQIYNNGTLSGSGFSYDTSSSTTTAVTFNNTNTINGTAGASYIDFSNTLPSGVPLNFTNNQAKITGDILIGPAGGTITLIGNEQVPALAITPTSPAAINSSLAFSGVPSSSTIASIVITGQVNRIGVGANTPKFVGANNLAVQGTGSTFCYQNALAYTSFDGINNFTIGTGSDTNVSAILAAYSVTTVLDVVNTTVYAGNTLKIYGIDNNSIVQLSSNISNNGLLELDNFANLTTNAINNQGSIQGTNNSTLTLNTLTLGATTTQGFINNLNSLTVNGNLNVINGSLSNISNFKVPGSISVPASGDVCNFNTTLTSLNGTFTVAQGASLNVGASGNIQVSSLSLAGALTIAGGSVGSVDGLGLGAITVSAANSALGGSNPVIKNTSSFIINSNASLNVPAGGQISSNLSLNGTLNLGGTLGNTSGGASSVINISTLTGTPLAVIAANSLVSGVPTINVLSGSLTVNGSIQGASQFTVASGATLTLNSGGSIQGNLTATGNAVSPANLNLSGGLLSGVIISDHTAITLSGGALPTISGTLNTALTLTASTSTTGTLQNIGTIVVPTTKIFNVAHGITGVNNFNVTGQLVVNTNGSIFGNMTFTNGTLNLNGGGLSGGLINLDATSSASLLSGSLASAVNLLGTLTWTGGSLSGPLTGTAGAQLYVQGPVATANTISTMGAIELKNGANLQVNNPITNFGSLLIDAGASLQVNSGGVLQSSGSGISNSGSLYLNGGSLNAVLSVPNGTSNANTQVMSGSQFIWSQNMTASTFTNNGNLIVQGSRILKQVTGAGGTGFVPGSGQLINTSGSELIFTVTSPTSFDNITSSNIVTLDGTVVINYVGSVAQLPALIGQPLQLISAQSLTRTSGPIMNIIPSSGSGLLSFDASSSTATKFIVKLRQNTFLSLAQSPQAQQMASVLDAASLNANAQVIQTVTQISQLPSRAAINEAFIQLSPKVHGAEQVAASQLQAQSLDKIALRLDYLRAQQLAGKTAYVAGDPITESASYTPMLFGSWAKQATSGAVNGFTAQSAGFGLLSDALVAEGIRLGLGASLSQSRIQEANTATNVIRVQNLQALAYGSFDEGGLFVDGALSVAHNRYRSQRGLALFNAIANAQYNGYQYGVDARTGYSWLMGPVSLVPNLALKFNHIKQEAYSEAGAGVLNLKVAATNTVSLRYGAGLRVNYLNISHADDITADTHIMFFRETKNTQVQVPAQILNGNFAFVTTGAPPVRNSINLGAGVSFFTLDNALWSLSYDGEFKRGYTNHSAFIKFRYSY